MGAITFLFPRTEGDPSSEFVLESGQKSFRMRAAPGAQGTVRLQIGIFVPCRGFPSIMGINPRPLERARMERCRRQSPSGKSPEPSSPSLHDDGGGQGIAERSRGQETGSPHSIHRTGSFSPFHISYFLWLQFFTIHEQSSGRACFIPDRFIGMDRSIPVAGGEPGSPFFGQPR